MKEKAPKVLPGKRTRTSYPRIKTIDGIRVVPDFSHMSPKDADRYFADFIFRETFRKNWFYLVAGLIFLVAVVFILPDLKWGGAGFFKQNGISIAMPAFLGPWCFFMARGNSELVRFHPKAKVPEEAIQRAGEPPFKVLYTLANGKRVANPPAMFLHFFESGEYDTWVSEFGEDEAARLYWEKIPALYRNTRWEETKASYRFPTD